MEWLYTPAFFAVGMGAIISSLLILIRVIPRMAHRYKWHTSFLWLFTVGLGSLGVAIVFEVLGHPSGILFFLIADAALVFGTFGLCAMWELRKLKERKKDENN